MNAHSQPNTPILELDLLRTLVAIAETGNFSSAAQAVHRTPSAVSMQVKKMEDLLGRPLFLRDSRSVRLTADGEVLLEHGRRLLALNREVVSRFLSPDLTGEVRLGAPDDVAERFLPDMLRRFADTHPGVAVNVVIEGSADLVTLVAEGRLDMALVTCEADGKTTAAAEILYRERLAWAALIGGVAAEQDPLPVSVWEEGCVWRDAGLRGLEAAGRAYRVAFQSAHISGQRAAILADLAVAPLPVSSLGGRIGVARPETGLPPLPEYALGLCLAAGKPGAAARAAADHLRAAFAAAHVA
ncbi:MAG: LysR substrate-binding domain-containing protein [Pseudomonadota bacterium]